MIPRNSEDKKILPKKKQEKKGSEKKKKRNPLDHYLDELECYNEGCSPNDLMSSGE